jgi:hypothetical protein
MLVTERQHCSPASMCQLAQPTPISRQENRMYYLVPTFMSLTRP